MLSSILSGLRTRGRVSRQKERNRYTTHLPLGYTSVFAQEFLSELGYSDNQASLLCPLTQEVVAQNRSDRTWLTFQGDEGQWQRITGLAYSRGIPESVVTAMNDGWLGHGKPNSAYEASYCRQMLTSRYVLCPPGYVANETFRLAESLICQSVPVGLNAVVNQGLELNQMFRRGVFGWSWSEVVSTALIMSESDRRSRVADLQEALRKTLSDLRHQMSKMLRVR